MSESPPIILYGENRLNANSLAELVFFIDYLAQKWLNMLLKMFQENNSTIKLKYSKIKTNLIKLINRKIKERIELTS
ncbi:MAG: hypothetical protein ACTS77_02345 [Arsenophonus sp. NC-TX2-MAG3]